MYTDGHLVVCDRLMDAHGQHMATAAAAAYYQQQMESPPCYTIATGLPTYDEALHHHQQHFSYGMKFMYPSITAVHHHPAIAGVYSSNTHSNGVLTNTVKQQCDEQQQQVHVLEQQLMKQKSHKVSPNTARSSSAELVMPATYDIADLHGLNLPLTAMSVTAPLLGVQASAEKLSATLDEVLTIRLDEMTPTATLPTVTTATTTTRRPTMFYNELARDCGAGEEQLCSAVTIA
ncbi:unnamed protein product [Ceratitis capitata]|uniref:(Mediterranean fruit fly) hypothetical protein n=1 Tax=Ceratitis capitata TaxID=7213 RepID=A0A811V6A8_CERCA|nr:unnamed protein product [Ceratitis capitata]